jgi:hypothetical protein
MFEIEGEVLELSAMGKLLGVVLQGGDISNAANADLVEVGSDEATALYWLGLKICGQIVKLEEAYYGELDQMRAKALGLATNRQIAEIDSLAGASRSKPRSAA